MIVEYIFLLVQEGTFGQADLAEVFSLGSGVFALVLLGISLVSYRKVRMTRLLLVSAAFALFALKILVEHIDLLFPTVEAGAAASVLLVFLDFVILLLFFLALVKKESRGVPIAEREAS